MSSIGWGRCECCSRQFGFALESALVTDHGTPPICGGCERRGRLCMHNVFERYRGMEPGTFRVVMHRSKPHRDARWADNPENCEWCAADTTQRVDVHHGGRCLLEEVQ